jgi:hypothetical protein
MTEEGSNPGRGSRSAGREPVQSFNIFEPGRLMPVQYDDLIRRRGVIDGEKRLMLAVLEDAIRSYLRNLNAKDGERRREFLEVKNWFNSGARNQRIPNVFAFQNLCEALGIEPVCLLERLRAMTIDDLPARRYQNRRHRPLSSLRLAIDRAPNSQPRSLHS